MNKDAWTQELEDKFNDLAIKFQAMRNDREAVNSAIRSAIREFLTKELGMEPGATITLSMEEMFMKRRVDIAVFLDTLPQFDPR